MKVSGFTYARNSFKYGYPVVESIQSILPICDEFIAVVGDSIDGTREAIEAINSPKIKIIDTIWDDSMQKAGKIFAQQANIGLRAITGDWGFHIQSDEVIHEDDLNTIRSAMEANLHNQNVEGLLLKFIHFVGDYKHIQTTRRSHKKEIRIVRNRPDIYSYRDSMGFRIYPSSNDHALDTNSKKLKVKLIDASIFHYSYCRHPDILLNKAKQFSMYYHTKEEVENKYKQYDTFDFQTFIDVLEDYNGPHPSVMKNKIDAQDWNFVYDKSKNTFETRSRILHFIEKLTGWRIGEYKNYKLIK